MPRLCLVPLALLSLAFGCSDSASTSPDAASSTPADCSTRCTAKAQTCGAPATQATQACATLCPKVTSGAQLTCLEGSSCADLTKVFQSTGTVCGIGSGTPTGGAFGASCKCDPDTQSGGGEIMCSGTGICETGLSCIGTRTQGVDHGTCRGPVCCTGAQCNTVLGTQGNCGTGQKCKCERGDLECVGDSCTCVGGTPATKGLCWPS